MRHTWYYPLLQVCALQCILHSLGAAAVAVMPPNCLRILAINDVYDLKNLPYVASAKKNESQGPCKVILVAAGDLVFPSVLSSIDQGKAMIATLNAVKVDFACFGES